MPESLFLINFVKKEPLNRCFPVNFAKFLRKPLLPPDECFCNKKKCNYSRKQMQSRINRLHDQVMIPNRKAEKR